MRDPNVSDSGSAKGPKGAECRDDMISVSMSLGRINDALREAEKWIGSQTWLGVEADRWYQGPWYEARTAFTKMVSDLEQEQNDCITAADKLDQAASTVKP